MENKEVKLNKNDVDNLKEYRKKIASLSNEEKSFRDLYVKKIASGEIQGPSVGYPELDKPWLKYYDDEVISTDIPKMNVFSYAKECNLNNMDGIALVYFGKKTTYKEFFEEISKTEKALKAAGIGRGDTVSVCLPTMPETFYIFFALNKIGAIANMIDPRINEERIEQCIGENSKLVVTVDNYNLKIKEATDNLNIKNIVSLSASNSLNPMMKALYKLKVKTDKVDGFQNWNSFIKKGKNIVEDESNVYEAGQPAAVVYTSGTTGVPKGVYLSNENINGVAFQQKSVLPDMKMGDRFLDIMPPFIAYGLVCGLCTTITTGQELVLIPKFEPKEFAELVKKHKPNHVLGVPSFFEDLCRSNMFKENELSFLKYCIAGGDKMNIESEKRINESFEKLGVKNRIIKGYGMTELSSGVIINVDGNCNKLGSVGVPLVKNSVKVLDANTNEILGYNQTGEVYISSPTQMMGYKNNEEEQKKVEVIDENGQSWIRTGDLGRVDEEGHITIDGRIKRMIVRPDGHNVFPSVIEDVITSHKAVDKCTVIGLKSEEYQNGAIPTACIVLKPEFQGLEKEVENEINEMSLKKLPPRDVALSYRFVEQIPYTSVGKVDYVELENMMSEKNKVK